MKLYLAGAKPYLKYLDDKNIHRILFTFWSINDAAMKYVKHKKWDLFMDCGAYSAWTRGKEISVHDYAKFIIKYKDQISVYPNLDVKEDTKQTIENLKILEEEYGLNPIPVFHVKTREWELLEKYIEKYDYIALGAIAGEKLNDASLSKVLDNVFVRAKKDPVTKFHGFGFTIKKFLEKYPFYSVDSTSWLQTIMYGQIPGKETLIERMHITKRDIPNSLGIGLQRYVDLEKYISDLWVYRGINWK